MIIYTRAAQFIWKLKLLYLQVNPPSAINLFKIKISWCVPSSSFQWYDLFQVTSNIFKVSWYALSPYKTLLKSVQKKTWHSTLKILLVFNQYWKLQTLIVLRNHQKPFISLRNHYGCTVTQFEFNNSDTFRMILDRLEQLCIPIKSYQKVWSIGTGYSHVMIVCVSLWATHHSLTHTILNSGVLLCYLFPQLSHLNILKGGCWFCFKIKQLHQRSYFNL